MNIYFLLAGKSTEKKIYESWLKYLIPELTKVKFYHQVNQNNYCLVSAHGYPSIIHEYIPDAIKKIQETDKYTYQVICLDAHEETVPTKKQEIEYFIVKNDQKIGVAQSGMMKSESRYFWIILSSIYIQFKIYDHSLMCNPKK